MCDCELSKEFNSRYGAAIRSLREEKGLQPSDIKGLDESDLKRLEDGEVMIHSAQVSALAKAHGMLANDYLHRLAEIMGEHGEKDG